MIIYPLPPEQLDDVILDKQIKSVAQILCNVHHMLRPPCYCCDEGDELEDCTCMEPHNLPLDAELNKFKWDDYSKWAFECRANYLKLVDMGMACINEHCYRFERHAAKYGDEKYFDAIHFARDNVPQFSNYHYDNVGWPPEAAPATPFPLVMPEKYIVKRMLLSDKLGQFIEPDSEFVNIIESYRNYYKSKLPNDAKWTGRTKPAYLILEEVK